MQDSLQVTKASVTNYYDARYQCYPHLENEGAVLATEVMEWQLGGENGVVPDRKTY